MAAKSALADRGRGIISGNRLVAVDTVRLPVIFEPSTKLNPEKWTCIAFVAKRQNFADMRRNRQPVRPMCFFFCVDVVKHEVLLDG